MSIEQESTLYIGQNTSKYSKDIVIWLISKDRIVEVALVLDGKRLDSRSQLIPSELQAFTMRMTDSAFIEQKLIYLLDRLSSEYQIVVDYEGMKMSATWNTKVQYSASAICQLSEGAITLSYSISDISEECRIVAFGSRLSLNLKDGELSRLVSSAPPILKEHMNKPLLAAKTFNSLGLVYNQSTGLECLFSVNKKPVGLVPKNVDVRVMIYDNPEVEDLTIESICTVEGYELDLSLAVFQALQGIQYVSVPMAKETRLKALKKAVLMLLSADTKQKRDDVLEMVLSESLFSTSSIKYMARRYLVQAHEALVIQRSAQVMILKDMFVELECDYVKTGLSLAIPYLLFDLPLDDAFDLNKVVVPRGLLYKNLSVLYRLYQDKGIDVYINDKRVESVDLQINLTSNSKTQERPDWFDLHPDIRLKSTSDKSLDLSALAQNPVLMESDTVVSIASAESWDTLQYFVSWWEKQNNSLDQTYHTDFVSIPRLKILELLELREKGIQIQLSDSDTQLLEGLMSVERIPNYPIPNQFKGNLWEFQGKGVSWLCFLYQFGFGACLADDMGLGKTVQTIAFLAIVKEQLIKHPSNICSGPYLLVVPPSLIYNWVSEIERFCPSMTFSLYIGLDREMAWKDVDIVITSYDIVRRDSEFLKEVPFHILIFDEAQHIKNIRSMRTRAVRQLKGDFRITLTGTPIENHLSDFYSIMDLSVPGLLEPYSTFMARVRGGESRFFLGKTRPFILRRKKEDVLSSLPPKVESDVYLDLSESQKAFYTDMIGRVRRDVRRAFRDMPGQQAGIIALTALLRLRQICISPALIDNTIQENSPKIDCLLERLGVLHSEGHSALVFSQFTMCLDLIERNLNELKIPFLRLDGSTATKKRKVIVDTFQNSEGPMVLIMSLKAGGVGLNLTRASYVFHVDPWWNPAVENQATDRAHRIGQKQKVLITRLIMKHTIEEKMMALKEKKLELYSQVLDNPEQPIQSGLTWEDFEQLLDPS